MLRYQHYYMYTAFICLEKATTTQFFSRNTVYSLTKTSVGFNKAALRSQEVKLKHICRALIYMNR